MENEIKSVARKPSGKCQWDGLFTRQAAETARNFHRTIPGYAPTPLVDLKGLAKHLGLEAFYVKDESFRFGLNAFSRDWEAVSAWPKSWERNWGSP